MVLLLIAVNKGCTDVSTLLVSNNGAEGSKTRCASSPLLAAVQNDHFSVWELLLEGAAEVDTGNNSKKGAIPLICVASEGLKQHQVKSSCRRGL